MVRVSAYIKRIRRGFESLMGRQFIMQPDMLLLFDLNAKQGKCFTLVRGLPYGMHSFNIIAMDKGGTFHNYSYQKVGTDLVVKVFGNFIGLQLTIDGSSSFHVTEKWLHSSKVFQCYVNSM